MSGLYSATIVTGTVWNSPENQNALVSICLFGEHGESGEMQAWKFEHGSSSTRTSLLYLPRQLGCLTSITLRLEYVAGLGVLIDRASVLDRCSGLVYLFNAGRWMMCPGQKTLSLRLSGVRKTGVPIPKLARVNLKAPTRQQLLKNLETLKVKCKSNDSGMSVGEVTPVADGMQCTVYIEVSDMSVEQRRSYKYLGYVVARFSARLRFLMASCAAMVLQAKIRALLMKTFTRRNMQGLDILGELARGRLTSSSASGKRINLSSVKQYMNRAAAIREAESVARSHSQGLATRRLKGKMAVFVDEDDPAAAAAAAAYASMTPVLLPGQLASPRMMLDSPSGLLQYGNRGGPPSMLIHAVSPPKQPKKQTPRKPMIRPHLRVGSFIASSASPSNAKNVEDHFAEMSIPGGIS